MKLASFSFDAGHEIEPKPYLPKALELFDKSLEVTNFTCGSGSGFGDGSMQRASNVTARFCSRIMDRKKTLILFFGTFLINCLKFLVINT